MRTVFVLSVMQFYFGINWVSLPILDGTESGKALAKFIEIGWLIVLPSKFPQLPIIFKMRLIPSMIWLGYHLSGWATIVSDHNNKQLFSAFKHLL